MCAIIDANMYGDFIAQQGKGMKFLKKWIDRHGGRIAYVGSGRFKEELDRHNKMREVIEIYRDIAKLKIVNTDAFEEQEKALAGKPLQSNDKHIIALARAGKIKLLVSRDRKLHADFTDCRFVAGGKVYQNAAHGQLLKKDRCP